VGVILKIFREMLKLFPEMRKRVPRQTVSQPIREEAHRYSG
jgi:hypothetical protein